MQHIRDIPLTNEQIQVVLTGKFGDGCLATNSRAKFFPQSNFNYYYMTSSIYVDYIRFKKQLLGNLCRRDVICETNGGYKDNPIFKISTLTHPQITEITHESIEKSIKRMDELGLALWFYDDGSLHQHKYFYNLNTQAFSREVNADVIVPFLKEKFDIIAIPTIERKKDGREYWYLRVRKYEGAFRITDILSKYPISCFSHKRIDDITMRKWNLLKEDFANTSIDITAMHPKTICSRLNKIDVF